MTRITSRSFPLRGMMALAAALSVAPTSLLAAAQIQGTPDAVRIETQNSSIEEVLAALGNAFDVRFRSSANLAKQLSGTYEGTLQRVVARVLEGYDFIIRKNNGKIEITVLGIRGAAPGTAVASSASSAPKATPAPAAPVPAAAPTTKTTEQPAPTTPAPAPASKPIRVAEGQIPGLVPATEPVDLSKIPGMSISAAPSEGQTPGLVPSTSPTDLSKIPGMTINTKPTDGEIPGLMPAGSSTDLSKIPGMTINTKPTDGEIPGLVPAGSPTDLSKIPGMSIVASPMPTTGLTPNSADPQGPAATPGLMPATPPASSMPAAK
jgi:hypothetical protein